MLVASRMLTLREGNSDVSIPIRVFVPELTSTGAWACRYEIGWPDTPSAKEICGFDSMQALVLALQVIGAEVYSSSYHEAGTLYLQDPGKGYGFPVAPTLRDLLIGDDAKFF